MKELKYLIIHCTDTPEGRAVTPDDIHQWHLGAKRNANGTYIFMGGVLTFDQLSKRNLQLPSGKILNATATNGNGWSQVGYSDMILLNGKLVNLVKYDDNKYVEPWEITNGVAGVNNVSRHIVYVGGRGGDTRNKAQTDTLANYVIDFVKKHPNIKIAGHYQFDLNKKCPGFSVPNFLHSISGIKQKNIYGQ